MHWREVIRRPIITEKTNILASDQNQYTFMVHDKANKIQIREAVELAFPDVTVLKVRVSVMPAKRARRFRKVVVRRRGFKKAIVTLGAGESIDMFEGV
ncbi:MAG: 50S ribosomal protein L23 [Anaerolineales bacterium]|nr:50S ribosomal protein L23 [Anaerolineales bacterium]MCB0016531.1 50S ribosomal protein L23 [Anaerolineales bacterium]MCB0029135.1 50S ribosomal protein L23 [Anaerolineales bacterium]MCB8959443.1 50S ribosomal protein L23 [Ardenticatenales bacterium]